MLPNVPELPNSQVRRDSCPALGVTDKSCAEGRRNAPRSRQPDSYLMGASQHKRQGHLTRPASAYDLRSRSLNTSRV